MSMMSMTCTSMMSMTCMFMMSRFCLSLPPVCPYPPDSWRCSAQPISSQSWHTNLMSHNFFFMLWRWPQKNEQVMTHAGTLCSNCKTKWAMIGYHSLVATAMEEWTEVWLRKLLCNTSPRLNRPADLVSHNFFILSRRWPEKNENAMTYEVGMLM